MLVKRVVVIITMVTNHLVELETTTLQVSMYSQAEKRMLFKVMIVVVKRKKTSVTT